MNSEQRYTSRYLTPYFIEQTLKRGKGVGQFLGWFTHNNQKAIRYLLIYWRQHEFQVWVEEHYDEGTPDSHGEIGDYLSLHDESIQHTFTTPDEALEFTSQEYNASRERWVNESMLDGEYSDALQNLTHP